LRRSNPGSTGESGRLRVVMALRVGPNILRIVLQRAIETTRLAA
jgi:hypothetical protein